MYFENAGDSSVNRPCSQQTLQSTFVGNGNKLGKLAWASLASLPQCPLPQFGHRFQVLRCECSYFVIRGCLTNPSDKDTLGNKFITSRVLYFILPQIFITLHNVSFCSFQLQTMPPQARRVSNTPIFIVFLKSVLNAGKPRSFH